MPCLAHVGSQAAGQSQLTPVQSLSLSGMLLCACLDPLNRAGPLALAQQLQAAALTPAQSPAAAARAARPSARSPRQTWMPSTTRPSAGNSAAWPRTERLLLSQGVSLLHPEALKSDTYVEVCYQAHGPANAFMPFKVTLSGPPDTEHCQVHRVSRKDHCAPCDL